jgi:hypothetical protein
MSSMPGVRSPSKTTCIRMRGGVRLPGRDGLLRPLLELTHVDRRSSNPKEAGLSTKSH